MVWKSLNCFPTDASHPDEYKLGALADKTHTQTHTHFVHAENDRGICHFAQGVEEQCVICSVRHMHEYRIRQKWMRTCDAMRARPGECGDGLNEIQRNFLDVSF